MVDEDFKGTDLFSHESTVSQSVSHIVRLMIIQQLDNVMSSWRVSQISKGRTSNGVDRNVFLAHVRSLLFIIREPWVRRDSSKVSKSNINRVCFSELNSLIKDEKDDELLNAIYFFLDEIELTKFDTKKDFNRLSVVQSNKHHGFA